MGFDPVESAARNNASLCNAVCRAHGCATEFVAGAWLTLDQPPPYYSNLVTMRAGDSVASQQQLIRSIVESKPERVFGFKDSFFSIDPIAAAGSDRPFRLLFDASWFCADTRSIRRSTSTLTWTRVASTSELAAWENVWRGNDSNAGCAVGKRQFPETLLSDCDLAFLAGRDARGALAAVSIANRSDDDVIGLSNVSARGIDLSEVWPGAIEAAIQSFEETRWLVGYERGEALTIVTELGLTAVGPLRVFVRDEPPRE